MVCTFPYLWRTWHVNWLYCKTYSFLIVEAVTMQRPCDHVDLVRPYQYMDMYRPYHVQVHVLPHDLFWAMYFIADALTVASREIVRNRYINCLTEGFQPLTIIEWGFNLTIFVCFTTFFLRCCNGRLNCIVNMLMVLGAGGIQQPCIRILIKVAFCTCIGLVHTWWAVV